MFSTLTVDEQNKYKGRKPAPINESEPMIFDESVMAATVDWRTKGAVNKVQDQGQCGSCWAFSATAAMEGEHFIKSGTLLKLSESQVVDCDTKSDGCDGGLEIWAFNYLKTHGQELEVDYPYKARTRSCNYVASKGKVHDISHSQVTPKSASQLKAAIAKQPVCVSVDAGTPFMNYQSGILDSTKCGTNLDHAITAVGYGTESGVGYFIVRNSWGTSWGEKGYIRMADIPAKKNSGVCGVLLDSNVPVTD